MKVSIIIPIYNVSAYIERCLHSVFNQTYQNIECILIDDASPDNSIEIAEELIKKESKKDIQIIRHPVNRGLGAARNSGIKASSGDYLFFLDSDDEISLNCIELLINSFRNEDIDLALGEIKVIGNKRSLYPPLLLKDGIYRGNTLDLFLTKQWYEMACNKLIKRSILIEEDNLFFNEDILHEDTLWSFHVAQKINSLSITKEETYHYYIQKNSITQKKTERNIQSFYLIIKEIVNFSDKNSIFTSQKNIFFYLEGLRIYYLKNLLNSNLSFPVIISYKNKLNLIFREKVWPHKNKNWSVLLKETILSFLIKMKR